MLDEADRMLDLGFEPHIRAIVSKVGSGRGWVGSSGRGWCGLGGAGRSEHCHAHAAAWHDMCTAQYPAINSVRSQKQPVPYSARDYGYGLPHPH